MNLQLAGTEEFVDGKSTGTLGQVLIRCVSYSPLLDYSIASVRYPEKNMADKMESRCNNVLWISSKPGGKQNGDTEMRG